MYKWLQCSFILVAAVAMLPTSAIAGGVSDTEIVFGMTGAFSGTSEKEVGYQARAAFEAGLQAQNVRGGVHGRKFRLVALNDSYDPAKTAAANRELVEKHGVFALHNGGTPMAMVTIPYANQAKIPYLSAMTGSPIVRNNPPDRYVFIFRASYAEETAAVVKYLVNVRRIHPSRIAVLAQDDGFGDAAFEGVARIVRQYRFDPRRLLRLNYKRNSTDVDDAVQTLLKSKLKIEAVVMAATFKPAARFIEKVREAGNTKVLFSCVSAVGSTELADELVQFGPSYTQGIIVTQVVPDPNSGATAMMKYREELKKFSPHARPGYLSVEAWIDSQIWIEAAKRAGKNLTRESFIDALESIKDWDIGIGVPITFGLSEHQGSHKVWGTVMDGKGRTHPLDLE